MDNADHLEFPFREGLRKDIVHTCFYRVAFAGFGDERLNPPPAFDGHFDALVALSTQAQDSVSRVSEPACQRVT